VPLPAPLGPSMVMTGMLVIPNSLLLGNESRQYT